MLNSKDLIDSLLLIFFMTTILFVLISIVSMNKLKRMRKKISDMLEVLAGKDKELNKAKSEAQNILSPFIPETSRSIIISMDPTGKIIDTNDYACELFGFSKEDLIGKKAFGLIFPDKQPKAGESSNNIIARILANPKLYVEHETENIKKSGERLWISWTNRVMYDDSGKATELRSVGFDITKRKRLEEELRYMATIDPQTGVLNRQAFWESGIKEFKRAERYKRNLSILVMRLDYFHETTTDRDFSDDIIRRMVTMTKGIIRESDYIGRVGDIEFAILLPETSETNANVVAERIRKKIEGESLKDSDGFFVTIRFGISEKKSDNDSVDEMLLRALNAFQKKTKKTTLRKTKKRKDN